MPTIIDVSELVTGDVLPEIGDDVWTEGGYCGRASGTRRNRQDIVMAEGLQTPLYGDKDDEYLPGVKWQWHSDRPKIIVRRQPNSDEFFASWNSALDFHSLPYRTPEHGKTGQGAASNLISTHCLHFQLPFPKGKIWSQAPWDMNSSPAFTITTGNCETGGFQACFDFEWNWLVQYGATAEEAAQKLKDANPNLLISSEVMYYRSNAVALPEPADPLLRPRAVKMYTGILRVQKVINL